MPVALQQAANRLAPPETLTSAYSLVPYSLAGSQISYQQAIQQAQPDFVLILPWSISDEVMKQKSLSEFGSWPVNTNSYGIPERALNLQSYHDLSEDGMNRVVSHIEKAVGV